jgi:hypothetical protein
VLEHVVPPCVRSVASRLGASEVTSGSRGLMASTVTLQICVCMEDTGAPRMITAVYSFMFETDMGAEVTLSVHSLQFV